jgi:hypothetical protein
VTTTAPHAPHTALAVLFGPDEDGTETLGRQVAADKGGLGKTLDDLPKATREAAVREVARAVAGLLDVSLVDLIVDGWCKYEDLVSAARRTLAVPDSVELVRLATHEITATQQPSVDVLVDGRRIATVDLNLSVVFNISALLAEICAGLLMAVESGHCDVTAALAIEGAEVITRQTRLELPGVFPLRRGIRLLPAKDYPPSVPSATTAEPAETAPAG